jgi:hypothetical protein
MLGHGGDSETSERYYEPHEIATVLKFVEKLLVMTADSQPQQAQLLPWVLKKQVAPFSQPSRSKRGAGSGLKAPENRLVKSEARRFLDRRLPASLGGAGGIECISQKSGSRTFGCSVLPAAPSCYHSIPGLPHWSARMMRARRR